MKRYILDLSNIVLTKKFALLVIILTIIYVYTKFIIWFDFNYKLQFPIILRSPITEKYISPISEVKVIKPDLKEDFTPDPTPTPSPTPKKAKKAPPGANSGKFEGFVSHYSEDGCLGCDPNLVMANGERLDDSKHTIAMPPGWVAMNTKVKLTNTSNGKTTTATVTDTGGFWDCCQRIADLTPAVAGELDTKTDQSLVIIEVI